MIESNLPIPPGDYLAETLAVKGITQLELAQRMRCKLDTVNSIIEGTEPITAEIASQLARETSVGEHIWLGLESGYRRLVVPKIKTEAEYRAALAEIDELFSAAPGTFDAAHLMHITTNVERYEQAHCPIDAPTREEIAKFRIDQMQEWGQRLVASNDGSYRIADLVSS